MTRRHLARSRKTPCALARDSPVGVWNTRNQPAVVPRVLSIYKSRGAAALIQEESFADDPASTTAATNVCTFLPWHRTPRASSPTSSASSSLADLAREDKYMNEKLIRLVPRDLTTICLQLLTFPLRSNRCLPYYSHTYTDFSLFLSKKIFSICNCNHIEV